MAVKFKSENHLYESVDPGDGIKWISVTTFCDFFKQKFDPIAQSIKSSQNKRSKWFGMKPEDIRRIWSGESERASGLGTFYHNLREADLIGIDNINQEGLPIPVIKPIMDGNVKMAPDQRLTEGIYPEHFIYLKSSGICGQSDRVDVVSKKVSILDYKTSKEIKKESFKSWDGTYQMMTGPCSHLMDSNFNHYSLQLSLYLYMILKHNPIYSPGTLTLQHIIFETTGEDQYGNPITKFDIDKNPVVKEIVPYKVPYLKNEIREMIKWYMEKKLKIKI